MGITDGSGNERPLADALVRAYPPAVAGEPLRWSWDADTGVFILEFRDRDGATGETEIYLPARRFYPGGFDLAVTDPEGSYSSRWDAERKVLHLTVSPSSGVHRVTVRPKRGAVREAGRGQS